MKVQGVIRDMVRIKREHNNKKTPFQSEQENRSVGKCGLFVAEAREGGKKEVKNSKGARQGGGLRREVFRVII